MLLRARNGFTLIELLVVISIIALLIGILLPALGAARRESTAVGCAANQRSVAQAMTGYETTNDGFYPPSYLYADGPNSKTWDEADQRLGGNDANGYIHWSFFLFDIDTVSNESFRCGEFEHGGVPATNPHPDYELDGQQAANPGIVDRQVGFVAFAANAVLIPRNKFVGANRSNILVRAGTVRSASDTIMASEFNDNWRAITDTVAGANISKSHRPVNALRGLSSGTGDNIFSEPAGGPRWIYSRSTDLYPFSQIEVDNPGNLISDGNSEINAVGRHHPGGDDTRGGTTNFVYADGHTERKLVHETLDEREWGDRHYSITGDQSIVPAE